MSKKATPWFPFYPDEWVGGTRHLDLLTRACYLELLIYQFANDHIPTEPLLRMNLCGLSDVGQWERIWRHLEDKFEVDDAGKFRNPRMATERDKAISLHQRSVENGKKGGRPKTQGFPLGSSEETHGVTNQNQNQNQNDSLSKNNSNSPQTPQGAVGEFFERWNRFAAKRPKIATCRKLTDKRTKALRSRLAAPGWLDDFQEAVKSLPLPGDGWQPTLDWLIKNDHNIYLLLEGAFDWRGKDDPASQRLAAQKRESAVRERQEHERRRKEAQMHDDAAQAKHLIGDALAALSDEP